MNKNYGYSKPRSEHPSRSIQPNLPSSIEFLPRLLQPPHDGEDQAHRHAPGHADDDREGGEFAYRPIDGRIVVARLGGLIVMWDVHVGAHHACRDGGRKDKEIVSA